MRMNFSDRSAIGTTKKTQEGYLIATARVARTGIQEYIASELGFVGDHIVKVYRPESEVFHKEALKSLSRVPVTVDHPSEIVTADNWKDLAVGEVGDEIMRDGDWLVVSPMIKDASALASVVSTHKEISMGYSAELRDASPDTGADYEMYNLRFNHLALVNKGRAGSEARIGDSINWGASPVTKEEKTMTVELKTVILGDKAVQVEAKDAETVAGILKDHKSVIDAKDAKIGELEVKLSDAMSKILSDEEIAKMISSKIESDNKRKAVIDKVGDKAKDWTDAQIDGAFLALDFDIKADDTARNAISDKKQELNADQKIQDAIKRRFNKDVK